MTDRRVKGAALTLAAAAVAMALSSCGSSDNSGGSSGGGGGGEPILIGQIAGTTGAYGSTGVAMVNGAKLAVSEINKQGGIDGRQVKLTNYNDKADPTLSSQLYRRLVSDGAVAVLGSGDTGPTTASMAQRLKVPNTGAVDDAGLTIYPDGPDKPPYEWVFSFGLNTYAWGEALGDYALENCQRLAVLHDPSTYGEGGNAGIKLAYDKAGKTIALDETINENWSTGATVSLDNELQKIKSANADCVVVWLTPQDTARFAQTARNQGATFKILGNDEINADDTFAKLAKSAADEAIGASLTTWVESDPELKKFQDDYRQRFGLEATPFASASRDAVYMLKQVIEDIGSTDPEKLRDGIESVSDFSGVNGSFSFSPQDHATITRDQLTLVQYDGKSQEWKPLDKQPSGG
jgi:ABC-type branched-subunit amino acid transport system substrate-binding protein